MSAPGLDAPATLEVPAGGSQTLELSLRPPSGSSIGNRSGNVVLTSGVRTRAHPLVGLRGAPAPGQAHSRPLTAGRWIKGDTREGAKLVQHYRWPSGPAGSGLPRIYPGREQLWSFTRSGGRRATPASSPTAPSSRRSCWPATRTASPASPRCPSNGNPYLETYGRFERVSGLLVPRPGRYFVVVETRPGHKPGPYRLRLWIDDRTPPAISVLTQHVPRGSGRAALPA